MKARELMVATRKALIDCASELDPSYRSELEAALARLEAVAGSGKAEHGPGDLKELQAACAALDEVTKPMAEVLMDKAMETLLRRRGVIQ